MATCFDQLYGGRPLLLLLVWASGIAAALLLFFGMLIDELTVVYVTAAGGLEYTITCQSSAYDNDRGGQNLSYSETEFPQALLQEQAGSVWLAFGILACLFLPFLLFGIITDYYAGIFDNKKPSDCWKGCCMLQTWGFTKISVLFMLLLELLQIISYSAAEKCGSGDFTSEIISSQQSTTSNGGAYVLYPMCSLYP